MSMPAAAHSATRAHPSVPRTPILYEPLPGKKVRCTACARYCVIPEGSHGFCFVRANRGGKLELLTYGKVAAIQVDPVEKKPLSHFHPGSRVFGIGTTGCNWRCQYCQNYGISQDHEVGGEPLSPTQAVDWAIRRDCQGITFTYNEPTIFVEYALDIIDEAHRRGLFANFVTNGYMSKEAVDLLAGKLDAVSVDLKGSGEPGFMRKYILAKGPEPILSTLEGLLKGGTHVEVTNLIVPEVGESDEALRSVAGWVRDHLGKEVPLHLLRFHPDYKMMNFPETPVSTLERLHHVAKSEGLDYVYLGNVWGHPLEHTYCPECGEKVVDRFGFFIRQWNLDAGNHCKKCGHHVPIVGTLAKDYEPTNVTPLM